MIDPLILRAELTVLLTNIGNYTFPDGSTTKAISVLPDTDFGYEYPPSGTSSNGIECVIKKNAPEIQQSMGGSTRQENWEIHLKQWDSKKSLLAECEKLLEELPQKYIVKRISYMPVSEKLLTLEQCKIILVGDFESTFL